MTDKTEMSLDDIIKLSKNSRGRGERKDGRYQGNKEKNSRQESDRHSVRPVASRTSARGHGRGRISRRTTRNDINNTRIQTFFEGFESRKLIADRAVVQPTMGPTKLMISNLHFKVSDLDVRELFSEFGHLKESAVHYDNSGRSLGTAHVIFERNDNAVEAMKKYNGVPLDGRPMRIQMSTSDIPRPMRRPVEKNMIRRRSIGGEGARSITRGQFRIPRGETNSTRRRRSDTRAPIYKRKQVTAEDLDKELDEYAKENPIAT